MAEPGEVPGVARFAQVSRALYRGAQPSRAGFVQLKSLGIRTIVNLRSFHSDRDEIAGLGLRYLHINAKAWHPEAEDYLAFLIAVRDRRNSPVFVHCQHGVDRTGAAVAVYRMIQEGWSREQAIAEMRAFGFHRVWKQTIERQLLRFDADLFRSVLRGVVPPRVEIVR